MLVLMFLLPLFHGKLVEADFLAVGSPVDVVIELHPRFLPPTSEQVAGSKVNDVLFERKAWMIFDLGALDLCVAAEGENVVADDVLLAVVLMEAAVRCAVDKV